MNYHSTAENARPNANVGPQEQMSPKSQARLIERLAVLFLDRCVETSTLRELLDMAALETSWSGGHRLFQRIRDKTLEVERKLGSPFTLRRARQRALEAQYMFEEVCAKTLYNLSGEPASFDEDSPEWIVPNALALAEILDISREQVVAVTEVRS